MALAGALMALLVLSAVVTTAFLTGFLEHRTARGGADAAHALEAAEAGLATVAGEWQAFALPATLAVGDSAVLGPVSLGRRVSFTPTVWRLTERLYLVRSEGIQLDAGGSAIARRAVGLLGRDDGAALVPLAQRGWLHLY